MRPWNKMVACVTLSAAACTGAQAAETTVGVAIALTGTYSYAGVPSRDGMLVALDEINSVSKDFQLRLAIEDTGSDKAQVITLLNRFAVRDRLTAMIGPTASPEAVAAAPVANELGIVMLTPTATTAEAPKAGKWAFKTSTAPPAMMSVLVDYAVDEYHAKRALLIYARDNEGQIGQERAVKRRLTERKVEIVGEESVLSSDTDFMALATNVTSLEPDIIFVASPAEQAANIMIQMKQAGLSDAAHFIGTPTMGSDRMHEIGGDAVEGATFAADYFIGTTSPENERFVREFKARFQRPPDNFAALGYTTVMLIARALQAADSPKDRDAVRKALAATRDMHVPLGTGRFSFDAMRTGEYGAVIVTVRKGHFVAVTP